MLVLLCLTLCAHHRQPRQRQGDFLGRILVILQFAGEIIGISGHVEMAVARQIKQNGATYAFFLAALSFAYCGGDRMIRFGRGHESDSPRGGRLP